jgi:WD40 repeat protein
VDDRWELACKPLAHQSFVFKVLLSPDGRFLLTGGSKRELPQRLWATETGQQIGPVLEGIVAEAFSPDSRLLVTAHRSGQIRLWDTVTGKPLGTSYWFPKQVESLRVTEDGSTLVIASAGQTWLWKLDPRPLAIASETVRSWVSGRTGLELDAHHVIQGLMPDNWKKHRARAER